MALPNPDEYSNALQSLRQSVADEEIREGRLAQTALGLPMLWSGGFADVYRVHCPQTGNTWALKCFTREVAARQERYRQIADHLEQARLPFTMEFKYLERGVLVAGTWYPIVKMRWVDGHLLNEFVEGHLDQPKRLRQFLRLWVKMAERLRAADMAHADLQHGNVLLVPVRDDQLALRLIDYDGMYLPALAGVRSGESGHPDYQHPQRLRQGTYNGEVDRFPQLAIYCAIHCLATEGSQLWKRFSNGDNLLFREQDFRDPRASELFRSLWQSKNERSRSLAGRLVLACNGPLEQTPLLTDVVRDGRVSPLNAQQHGLIDALLAPIASVSGGSVGPWWQSRNPVDVVEPAFGTERVAERAHVDRQEGATGSPIRQVSQSERRMPGYTASVLAALHTCDSLLARIAGRGNDVLRHFPRFATSLYLVFLMASTIWLVGIAVRSSLVNSGKEARPMTAAEEGGRPHEEPGSTEAVEERPRLAIAPFDGTQAKEYQRLWADRFGVPVEWSNSTGMTFVLIPAGEFMMGSADSDDAAGAAEKPQHRVRITRPFYLGKYPVTQEQWEAVMGNNPSRFKEPRNPVDNVTWNDCQVFLRRLNERAGDPRREFRLPTEAEWEFACRAGTTACYSFGNDVSELHQYAWYSGNSDLRTQPVGQKSPNAWGLCDMHGNVWEWCADWCNLSYDHYANPPLDDPPGPASGSNRVRRGGSSLVAAGFCRSAHRGCFPPGNRFHDLGVRISLVSKESESAAGQPRIARPEQLRLQPIAEQHVEAGDTVNVAILPEDAEHWTGRLRFALAPGAPAGAVIDAESGEFTWTPDADHQPGKFSVGVVVKGPEWQEIQASFAILVASPRTAPDSAAEIQVIGIDLGGGVTLEMVRIPAGEFMMGSPDLDREIRDDEKPQHRVRITQPFYLGKYEVTQLQWETVMSTKPSRFKGSTNPVENVGWSDCQEFMQRLNDTVAYQQQEFRLPTEAEWEYACRAGTTTHYSFGDDASALGQYAWYSGNSDRRTHPVGVKRPNAWGLYDMHGNVSEWCQDWYAPEYYVASPIDDPAGLQFGVSRVLRGGSWRNDRPALFRCANRDSNPPANCDFAAGFRAALVPAK